MALLIVAGVENYQAAATHLQSAGGTAGIETSVPSLGDGDAEAALGGFASKVSDYHARLTDAAASGAQALAGYAAAFERAGGGA